MWQYFILNQRIPRMTCILIKESRRENSTWFWQFEKQNKKQFWFREWRRFLLPVTKRWNDIFKKKFLLKIEKLVGFWSKLSSFNYLYAEFTCSYGTDHLWNVSLKNFFHFSFEFNETWWSFRTHRWVNFLQFTLNSNEEKSFLNDSPSLKGRWIWP